MHTACFNGEVGPGILEVLMSVASYESAYRIDNVTRSKGTAPASEILKNALMGIEQIIGV